MELKVENSFEILAYLYEGKTCNNCSKSCFELCPKVLITADEGIKLPESFTCEEWSS